MVNKTVSDVQNTNTELFDYVYDLSAPSGEEVVDPSLLNHKLKSP